MLKNRPVTPIIFLLTWIYIFKIQIGTLSINYLDLLIVIILLFNILQLRHKKPKRFFRLLRDQILNIPNLYIYLLFTIGFLLSTHSSISTSSGYGAIKSWIVIPLFFILALQIDIGLYGKKFLRQIFKFIILFATSLSFLALINLSLNFFEPTYDNRLKLFYESPNMLAMIISISILVTFITAIRSNHNRPILYTILAIQCITLIFTKSSGAPISLLFALSLIVLLQRIAAKTRMKSVQNLRIFLILMIFLILIFTMIGLYLYSRYNYYEFFHGPQSPLTSRFAIWRTSLDLIKNNFFRGIGPNNFQDNYIQYQQYYPPYPQWDAPHPHNIYLSFWLYGGIISFLSFCFLIFRFFLKISSCLTSFFQWKSLRKFTRGINYLCLIIILYILFHGTVENTILKNDIIIYFVFFVSLPFLIHKKN